jgi:hypothetical protein
MDHLRGFRDRFESKALVMWVAGGVEVSSVKNEFGTKGGGAMGPEARCWNNR